MPKSVVATIPCASTLAETMPAALPKAAISDIKPTPDELERVRQMRNVSEKQAKHSTDVAFKSYLRKNPDNTADSSTGELKEKCILNFMVLQLRSKSATKVVQSVHAVTVKNSKMAEKHWLNEFQMNRDMGAGVAKHWRDSNLLIMKPDPVTGSDLPEHVVYGVPRFWESMSEEDFKQLALESKRDAVQGDDEAIQELAALNKAGVPQDDPGRPKAEKTPAEVQQEYIDNIKAQPAQFLRQYQDARTNCVVLQAQVEPDKAKSKFCQMLFDDVCSLIDKLTKVLQVLEGMVSKPAKDNVVKKLAADITGVDIAITDVMKMGSNFGYECDGTKSKSKKRKAAK